MANEITPTAVQYQDGDAKFITYYEALLNVPLYEKESEVYLNQKAVRQSFAVTIPTIQQCDLTAEVVTVNSITTGIFAPLQTDNFGITFKKATTTGKIAALVTSLLPFKKLKFLTSVEQGITITAGVNDKIDFKEDGGAELTATLTPGDYHTVAEMETELKTQMELVGLGTYALAFDAMTKLHTLSVTGAVSAVQLLPVSGINSAASALPSLGYTQDTISAAVVISDTADTGRNIEIGTS